MPVRLATTKTNDIIAQAILYLAGRCDGAVAHDKQGFNGSDTEFGHSLANGIQQYGSLTDGQRAAAWRMLQKYRKQLADGGIILPNPNNGLPDRPQGGTYSATRSPEPKPTPSRNVGRVEVANDEEFSVSFPSLADHSAFFEMLNTFKMIVAPRGKRYDPDKKVWLVRRDEPGVIQRIKSYFPAFEIDSELDTPPPPVDSAWPEFECERLPGGKKPFKHQIDGVRFNLKWARDNHGALVADQMGLGKTITGLMTAKALGHKVIVLAPKSVMLNWLKEAEEVGVDIEVYSWGKVPLPPEMTKFVLLADEAHYAQNLKSKRTQGFLALALHPNCVACYPLTGTPIKNGRPVNLFPLLLAIRHPLAKDRRYYEDRYCGAKATRFSPRDVTGAAHLDELHTHLKPYLLMRKKADCLDLPAKTRVFKTAEVDSDRKKAYQTKYNELRAKYARRLAAGEIKSGGEALVLLNHLYHAGSIAKVGDAVSLALDAIEEGQQVVLFTEFEDSGQQIANQLGCDFLHGPTSQTKRQEMVDAFQASQKQALVCTIKAGGVGLTLVAGSVAILVDRPWTPGDALQAEDRIHRPGQDKNVTAIWLQYGEADMKRDGVLASKMGNIGSVLDGKPDELTAIDYKQLADTIFGGE